MKMVGLWALALSAGAMSMGLGYKPEWAALYTILMGLGLNLLPDDYKSYIFYTMVGMLGALLMKLAGVPTVYVLVVVFLVGWFGPSFAVRRVGQ